MKQAEVAEMTSNRKLGLGFKLVRAATLVAGVAQMTSLGSEPATAETEMIVSEAALPPVTRTPAKDLLTPASLTETETEDEPGSHFQSLFRADAVHDAPDQ